MAGIELAGAELALTATIGRERTLQRTLRPLMDRYDVILIDPPPPVEAAGSSLLYSQDFYAVVKERLQPGGFSPNGCRAAMPSYKPRWLGH